MSQTRLGSFVESWANIGIGFTLNYCANLLILPMFGFASLTPGKNFAIGVLYTGISLVRSFVLRSMPIRLTPTESRGSICIVASRHGEKSKC